MVDRALAEHLVTLEAALARRDPTGIDGGLGALIADDFVEFGSSGRRWDRSSILVALAAPAGGSVIIEDVDVVALAEDVALLTWRSGRRHRPRRAPRGAPLVGLGPPRRPLAAALPPGHPGGVMRSGPEPAPRCSMGDGSGDREAGRHLVTGVGLAEIVRWVRHRPDGRCSASPGRVRG